MDEDTAPDPYHVLASDLLSSAVGGISSFFKNFQQRFVKLSRTAVITVNAGTITNSAGDQNQITMINAVPLGGKYALLTTSSGGTLTAASPATANTGNGGSAQLVAANANRKGLVLTVTGATDVNLGLGVAGEAGKGITLKNGGGVWVMDSNTFTTAAINGYSSATCAVAIQEFT